MGLKRLKPKTRNELEELREENRRLRKIVADLSERILIQITETVEPTESDDGATILEKSGGKC